jgi:hypothetical protein
MPIRPLLLATLMITFVQTPASGGSPNDITNQFRGIWSGHTGYKTVQLDFKNDAAFHWTSTAGDARGEGEGHIRKDGKKYLIDLPFIQREPLTIQIDSQGKSMKLTGQYGFELILLKKMK